MWIYSKIRGGYVRVKLLSHADNFMFDILGSDLNRSILNKICERTFCKMLGHISNKIHVNKGYTVDRGAFEIGLCDRCKAKVLYYEGRRE
jgi:hypothetical protein